MNPNHLLNSPVGVVSQSPLTLSSPGRMHGLQVRISAPVTGGNLPVIIFSHGFASSMDAYAPLVNYWASRGFAVIQPTFLDSRTLNSDPKADHHEAVKAYLQDPRKHMMWRYRVADVKSVLDQLDLIESEFVGLRGRLDRDKIAAAGHSFGAQTTASLLGTRVINADGTVDGSLADARIRAGVLLSVGGGGGDALSPFAKEHFPHLNQSYAEMTAAALVVAGDQDHSLLTVRGPVWFTDAFHLGPGADALLSMHGGEHMLGGISGFLVRETTDENQDRVAVVQRLSWAYLVSTLYPGSTAWEEACRWLASNPDLNGSVSIK